MKKLLFECVTSGKTLQTMSEAPATLLSDGSSSKRAVKGRKPIVQISPSIQCDSKTITNNYTEKKRLTIEMKNFSLQNKKRELKLHK